MSTSPDGRPSVLVVFSHGKESGPRGRKIQALARVAQEEGAQTLSVNYQEHPSGIHHDHHAAGEADRRVAQLLTTPLPPHDRLVLVGSSMGGYVSALASCHLRVDGLFLLAPAFLMPGYSHPEPRPAVRRTSIVHGWRDEVIPWEHSARWAVAESCSLHLLDGDHRLDSALPAIEPLFRQFLRSDFS